MVREALLEPAKSSRRRSRRGSSELSQFGPVLYIVFLITLMPLLDAAKLVVAAGIQYLATNDLVAKAATQTNYDNALNTMTNEAYQFYSNGLARFINLTPDGGYTGCGDDMFVVSTDIASGKVTTSAADVPLLQAVDTKTKMYELSIESHYSVAPLVNLSSVPLLNQIPGLGSPADFRFTASRPVEHPSGLQGSQGERESSSEAVAMFKRVSVGSASTATANINTWRNPSIYQQIQAAGETIVAQNVFMVEASNPNWTSSGIAVLPGQKVWIDTQAIGVWSPSGSTFQYDANGGPTSEWSPYYFSQPLQILNLPMASLAGRMGTNGPTFLVGDDQSNYAPAGSGTLSMIFNNYLGQYGQGSGAQLVRVVVTN